MNLDCYWHWTFIIVCSCETCSLQYGPVGVHETGGWIFQHHFRIYESYCVHRIWVLDNGCLWRNWTLFMIMKKQLRDWFSSRFPTSMAPGRHVPNLQHCLMGEPLMCWGLVSDAHGEKIRFMFLFGWFERFHCTAPLEHKGITIEKNMWFRTWNKTWHWRWFDIDLIKHRHVNIKHKDLEIVSDRFLCRVCSKLCPGGISQVLLRHFGGHDGDSEWGSELQHVVCGHRWEQMHRETTNK